MNATDVLLGNFDNGSYEEEKEDPEENRFCTFAVTGTDPTFQAIFLCNDCFVDSSHGAVHADGKTGMENSEAPTQQSPLCVCQACAEVCHDDSYDDVEYIGMGPSYCDCSRLGNCKLHKKSMMEAERLGIVVPNDQEKRKVISSAESSPEDFIREAFDISMLQQLDNDETDVGHTDLLVEQARELTRHTKETHWIDENIVGTNNEGEDDASSQKKLCLLESLAWSIYQSHRERFKDTLFCDDGNEDSLSRGGAEWWVQVKNISTSASPVDGATVEEKDAVAGNLRSLASSSIDLHYDKDEALAESFGIGSFPALSTVTYLTGDSKTAAPTVVFDHTYTQGEDEVMSSMMVSRPRVGKHICFDGRLLHGAPYHPSLLSSSSSNSPPLNNGPVCEGTIHPSNQTINDPTDAPTTPLLRVTFLVNIWNDRRPANVHALDDAIRNSIVSLPHFEGTFGETIDLSSLALSGSGLSLTPLDIPKVSFESEDDMPEALHDRIELPFVSILGEDNDEDDDDERQNYGAGSTVVVTFPPPPTDDCILVTFGPGLQAYVDYNNGPEEDESDVESNVAQADDESSHSPMPHSQSDYV